MTMPKSFTGTPEEWRLLQIHKADALWISQHVKHEADDLDEDLAAQFDSIDYNDLEALSDARRYLYARQTERRRKAAAQKEAALRGKAVMGDPQTEEEKAAAIEKARAEAEAMGRAEDARLERERVRKDAEEAAKRRDKSYGDD